ncbi:amino-acid N-acetyltransferase subunit Mak10, putative [Talaromyces stipitatus ATCC 10500]|uniref:Amino-acid N-acetyltransferase subunit Mak10, putative n=1 Tax=Talaromyces stipitatus (strain ATCC 10500 / CBS 375.48 / QM 6759 / NRRL 1006) TaxID=441959 RepID=B8MK02_TALSN|nr:amino-acid N-acetyltransferase subunit Mak10, putative [Talaromyces stipitatus ATCC 10500]EED14819.1 amino-acid N-acetyltransferase subunit Mak10, putative [Talaromyces stipitatus ATCC 10500]
MIPNDPARVTPRVVPTQHMVARDITREFVNAASKLKQGELVKDAEFTLFEAVGALEIMDSKMDSGYLGPGESHAEALEYDYDVMRELQPEEVLGLVDQLLCHEMAWHMGHPLSQTLFTSIYLDKLLWPVPKSFDEYTFHRGTTGVQLENEKNIPLVHLVLRAYCLGLVKACDLVHRRITQEYYYEEEDFVPQLYNRSLLSEFDVEPVQKVLENAVEYLQKLGNDGISIDVRNALIDRLRLRSHFLAALSKDMGAPFSNDRGPFTACLALIPSLNKSEALGKPVPDSFTLKIQRKLASTIPPRPMVTIEIKTAIDHLKRLFQDAIDMHEILAYSSPSDLRVCVWTIASRKPQPGIYIRCLMQAFIVNEMKILGSKPAKQLFYDDLRDLVLPLSSLLDEHNAEIEVPSDPRFQIHQSMESFVARVAHPFVDTFRTSCLNRSRVRRALCHSILEWDNLQIEAEELDTHLQPLTGEVPLTLENGQSTYAYPLGSWVYHEKLKQMQLIFQMGFELSIYAPEELAGMYWYLSHLCSSHQLHIERIQAFVHAEGRRSSRFKGNEESFERTLTTLGRHSLWLIATESFSLGLQALYVFLERHKVLPHAASQSAYSSARLRYELRMKPFLSISLPELVSYDQYEENATLKGQTDIELLKRASRVIADARKAWEAVLAQGAFVPTSKKQQKQQNSGESVRRPAIEADWQRSTKDSLRACIGASIAIQTATKIFNKMKLSSVPNTGKKSETVSLLIKVDIPEVGSTGRYHDWWAVPRIAEVESG